MSKVTRQAGLDAIDGLSMEDLVAVIRWGQIRLQAMAKVAFKVGDRVEFDAKSRGHQSGVLIKKNAKTCKVLVGNTTWTVTPHLLRKAA